jgi:hypothetical protein
MTTVIPFIPSNVITPEFRCTLDGQRCKVTITWNIAALRYYINVYLEDGTWIITVPLTSSPPARNIQTISFDPFLNMVKVQLVDPMLWPVPLAKGGIGTKPGTIVEYTLMGFQPNDYNGKRRCLQINETTFTFNLDYYPPPVLVTGTVHRLINLIATVFNTSTLVYRNASFEINP